MPTPAMQVVNYKTINKNTLIASFDLHLPSGMVIYGAMVHRKNESRWITFPGKPYEKDGKITYAKLIEIPDRERRDRFNEQVFAALGAAGY